MIGGNGVVGHSNGSGVVGLDGRFGLWPTHLNDSLANRNHFLGGNEHEFCFSCGGHEHFYDLSNGENGAVESRVGVIFGDKYVVVGVAARTSSVEESDAGMSSKDHVAGAMSDAVVGVGGM